MPSCYPIFKNKFLFCLPCKLLHLAPIAHPLPSKGFERAISTWECTFFFAQQSSSSGFFADVAGAFLPVDPHHVMTGWKCMWATVSECEALGSQTRRKLSLTQEPAAAANKRLGTALSLSPGARLPRSLILLCLDSCVFGWLFLFHTTTCQLSVSLWCFALCNQNLFSSSLYTKKCSSRVFSRKKNSCVFMRMLGVVVSDKCLDSSLKPKGQETLL